MIGANFERASLFCADLREVVAENANFGRADLRGATLRGASLAGANLDEADLRRAALARTDLPSGFKLHGLPNGDADRGELAYSVDLTNCSLRRAQLNNSKLRGAKFTGAVLSGASLRGADLAGAVFDGAVMSGVELEGVRLSPGALLNCVLDPSPEAIAKAPDIMQRLAEARLWIATNGKQGSPAVLDDEDLRPLPKVFVDTTLVALSAKRACGIGVDFHGAQLQGANFTGADLRHADFTGADLRGASFANANLLHARFAQADLRPLALDNGGAVNVNLTEAKVSGAAFRESVRA